MRPNRSAIAATALAVLLSAGIQTCFAATIAGVVTETGTSVPVEGARVLAIGPAGPVPPGTLSDAGGRFRLSNLPAGTYALLATRIGFLRGQSASLTVGDLDSAAVSLALTPSAIRLNPTVVSASRLREKSLDAPASISVVGRAAIAERASITTTSHLSAVPGVDVVTKGLTQSTVAVRGFNSAQSAALLVLSDYRNASMPSLRYNLFQFIPTPAEDLERIEVVRGPGAAIYGPNCERGVVHLLSRSPAEHPGTSVSVVGGERDVLQGAVRHASRLGERWAVKVSGQYLRGREWPGVDTTEAENREAALLAGANPDTLRVGRRLPDNERAAAEARLDWLPSPETSLIASAGWNRALQNVDVTALGPVQVRDWTSTYAQLRGTHRGFFAQAFLNASDAGGSYFLRDGRPIVDESRFLALQAQQTGSPAGIRLVAGADAQWTIPRTAGSVMGRNESRDDIRELGAYTHAEGDLAPWMGWVAALRLDDHSRFSNPVLSPRAGLIWKPRPEQNLRLTYNRAFGTPAADDLFADLLVDSLRDGSLTLPYRSWVEGVPSSGFTFYRQGGRALMRSPFTPDSLGGAAAYLPPDATLRWEEAMAIMQSAGWDFVPAPTGADVASVLLAIQPDESIERVDEVRDLPALEPTITQTVELGYRALVGRRLRLSIEGYRTRVDHFIGHLRSVTPNVFLEPSSLVAYLSQFMSPDSAVALGTALAAIPLGTITPEQAVDPTGLIYAVRNLGPISLWGADAAAWFEITDRMSVAATFSWASRDLFHAAGSELALNAPARKGSLSLGYRDRDGGRTLDLRVRGISSFPVRSGVYVGTVRSYTLVDVAASVRLSSPRRMTLTATAENLLDRRHREFVGSPELGRLVFVRLATEL